MGRGLRELPTAPPSQMFRGDLIHRWPPCGSSWPAPASTAPASGGAGLAHPMGVVRRGERREIPLTDVDGAFPAAVLLRCSSSGTLCARAELLLTQSHRDIIS